MPLRSATSLHHALVALACVLGPHAVSAQLAPVLPDNAGVLAGACVNCHAPASLSTGMMPVIHGRDVAFLRQRLLDFRAQTAADAAATVMPRLMKGFSDAQIDAMATWFSQQKPEGR